MYYCAIKQIFLFDLEYCDLNKCPQIVTPNDSRYEILFNKVFILHFLISLKLNLHN